jgi:hypothetical protein
MVHLADRAPWMLPARPAGVRLLQLPKPVPLGLWMSFPVCNATGDSEAPPVISELMRRSDPVDWSLQRALLGLRHRCGGSVQRDLLLPVFGYEHLREQLPPELPITCEIYPSTSASASSQISS